MPRAGAVARSDAGEQAQHIAVPAVRGKVRNPGKTSDPGQVPGHENSRGRPWRPSQDQFGDLF